MRVALSNLGCKLNLAELERLARRFVARGHAVVESLEEAELHVVNTCTVTHLAARDSRKLARRGRRLNPGLRTVLTGCWVVAEPQRAAELSGVDLVIPNHQKEELVERVEEAFGGSPVDVAAAPPGAFEYGNARASVKVEDGCNMPCAFCIIPVTRGRQRSRPSAEILAEVSALAAAGFEEVVLTGVQISAYREDGKGLADLVERLLESTPVRRLRLTSIAPWQLDEGLSALFAHPRVCRHAHLSLQSGCEATLRRMRRPYTAAEFDERVAVLRRLVRGIAITTDVIVGFPGEVDSDAEESLAFVEKLEFARVHVFPYSQRPGTAAAALPEPVPDAVRRQRTARLLEVAEQSQRRFAAARIGEEAEVIWEGRRDGTLRGTTGHYLRVVAAANEWARLRSLQRVRLVGFFGDSCRLRVEPLPATS